MTESTNRYRYRTIVIDPPWNIGKSADSYNMGGAQLKENLPYMTMTDEEIEQFPINDYSADNCDLFMWVTHSTLKFGLQIIESWGFKYHCLLTWDKTNGLCILGFQRKTEYVIYAYKGKMGIKKKGRHIPTLFKERLTKHSQKPRIFYDILLKSTSEPRIDIFSRKKHIGFDSWCNQAEEPLTLTSFTPQVTERRNGNE